MQCRSRCWVTGECLVNGSMVINGPGDQLVNIEKLWKSQFFYGKINYVQCSIAMPKKSRGYHLVIMYSFLWKKMACLQMVSHDLTMTEKVLRRKLWAPRPDIKFYLHSGPFPYSKHIRNMNISTPYESQSSSISYPPHEIPIPHVW